MIDCRLYAEEKLNILFSGARRRNLMINKSNDIYCPCRYKGTFYRYTSTDELLRRKGIFVRQHGAGERPPVFKTQLQLRFIRSGGPRKLELYFPGDLLIIISQ